MTNKAQQDLLNQLNEYRQAQQLDEIGDFTKAIAKKVGQGVGAVKGVGQKVKGVANRSVAALGNAYTQGQTGAQKKVAGQDYKAPAAKQKPAQGQTPAKTGSTAGGVLGNLAKNVGGVVGDTVAGSGYDYRQGVNPNPTKTTGPAAGLQKADAEAQRKAGLEKKLGTTGAQATATNNANNAVDKSIARNQKKIQQKQGGVKQSGISQGIDIAGANKAVANLKAKQAGQTATKVPGQKAPVAQVDANKDGKDDKSGKPMAPAPAGKGPVGGAGGAAAQVDVNKDGKDDKTGQPISKTAQDVKAKAGVKAGGVALDPTNPEHKGLIAAIEKASPGLTKTVDKLDAGSKGKLLKGLQAA